MTKHEKVLQELKAEVEAIEDKETEVQSRMMDVKHELEKYAAKLKENSQKIKHFLNEVLLFLSPCLIPSLCPIPSTDRL